ncbi:hypothetical protein RHMOL_Rhmol01G0184900 [Rhododendron molle]|uniref:Uncharacterized protein n=1 Tax=Rhododendron molle TaxID=49168 RepID=A0ACC0Q4U1_RHOML|nr:hypothetical protein RHMOL_Rhmol01G0184900 [Rhododendron molle]
MDVKQAGPSLDSLISSFNTRIAELQELVIARNMYPASSVPDLSAVDATLKAMELQVQHIKDRLREETQAIPKAKKLIEASLLQQKKLQSISVHVPYHLPERLAVINREPSRWLFFWFINVVYSIPDILFLLFVISPLFVDFHGFSLLPDTSKPDYGLQSLNLEDEPALLPKRRKCKARRLTLHGARRLEALRRCRIQDGICHQATFFLANYSSICCQYSKIKVNVWFPIDCHNYIRRKRVEPLHHCGTLHLMSWIPCRPLANCRYMRGRLTLDKVNAVINEMSTYAEANAQLITAPRKKLSENMLDKALELREIGSTEAVKGKHFFLETDIKGPSLKLDNTGKAILTVLRHLGRIRETRIGHHRVYILLKPQ